MSNRITNSPETKSPPFKILKRTTWPQQILIDPEVNDFDNDWLYLICSICPQSNGCLKIIQTRAGRAFDLTRWK